MEVALVCFFDNCHIIPVFAFFNAGAAFFRAGGNSGFPVKASVTSRDAKKV